MIRTALWFVCGIYGNFPIIRLDDNIPQFFAENAHYNDYDMNKCALELVYSMPDNMEEGIYKVEFDIEWLKDPDGIIDDYKCLNPKFELVQTIQL